MIKVEVVFDGDKVVCNGFSMDADFENSEFDVCIVDGGYVGSFDTLEQAIAYCLEQSK